MKVQSGVALLSEHRRPAKGKPESDGKEDAVGDIVEEENTHRGNQGVAESAHTVR